MMLGNVYTYTCTTWLALKITFNFVDENTSSNLQGISIVLQGWLNTPKWLQGAYNADREILDTDFEVKCPYKQYKLCCYLATPLLVKSRSRSQKRARSVLFSNRSSAHNI